MCSEILCDIILIINRHFKGAQLTKNVTKAPAVTTVLNNRHKAKLNSKQHCLQALVEHVETERWVPKVCLYVNDLLHDIITFFCSCHVELGNVIDV